MVDYSLRTSAVSMMGQDVCMYFVLLSGAFLFLFAGNTTGVSGINTRALKQQGRLEPSVQFRPAIQAFASAVIGGCPPLKPKTVKVNCMHKIEKITRGIDCYKKCPHGTKAYFTCPNNTSIVEKYNMVTCGSPNKRKWSNKIVNCKSSELTSTTISIVRLESTVSVSVETTVSEDTAISEPTAVSEDATLNTDATAITAATTANAGTTSLTAGTTFTPSITSAANTSPAAITTLAAATTLAVTTTLAATTTAAITVPVTTTAAIMAPAATTSALTVPAGTTAAITAPATTTAALTAPAGTTAAITAPAGTTAAITAPASTTAAITAPAVTTSAITAPAGTTPAATTILATTTAAATTTADPYVFIGGIGTFKKSKVALSLKDATSDCAADGSVVMPIGTPARRDYVTTFLTTSPASMFTGAQNTSDIWSGANMINGEWTTTKGGAVAKIANWPWMANRPVTGTSCVIYSDKYKAHYDYPEINSKIAPYLCEKI